MFILALVLVCCQFSYAFVTIDHRMAFSVNEIARVACLLCSLHCEQRFLSCKAFSVYEVVRVACLSRSWLTARYVM